MGEEEDQELREEQELRKQLPDGELDRQLGIEEDFYSARAVAHASFFVASVFGLFTILAFMETSSMVSKALLSVTYWVVWGFGLYSFLNFSRYAVHAQQAESRTTRQVKPLIYPNETAKGQEKIIRGFERLRRCEWVSRHDIYLFLGIYFAVGVLVFVAFLLR